jgi:small subunit ribosomal protein S9
MAVQETIGIGRRKTAVALVKLVPGKGRIFINNRTLHNYVGERASLEILVKKPLHLTDTVEKYDVKVKTNGGGVSSQAGAVRHGISRALIKVNPEHRAILKSEGMLTRDPRVKERKKYGRKRARKRFQFSKR